MFDSIKNGASRLARKLNEKFQAYDEVQVPAGRYLLPKVKLKGNRGKGKGGVPALLVLHRSIRSYNRPERPRHWHNPADPIQAARIEAARGKRERKAQNYATNIHRGYVRNDAHHYHDVRLDPFHVVRS